MQLFYGLIFSVFLSTLITPQVTAESTAKDDFADCKGTETLFVGSKGLRIEVARDQRSRSYGLMFRRSMGRDCGMLFVFDDSRRRTFTMRNTLIPLDIAFIDSEGKIQEIFTMQPGGERYPSRVKAHYALETNSGWFAANKISTGQLIQLLGNDQPVSLNRI